MKRLLFLLVITSCMVLSCSKEQELFNENIFRSDTLPAEIIHDVIFSSTDEMWILGSSYDPDAELPEYSSVIPYKMQLIKKVNNRYVVYDRIPNTIKIVLDNSDNLLSLGSKVLRIFKNESFELFSDPKLDESAHFQSMVVDNNNILWATGVNTGIFKFDGNDWQQYTSDNSILPGNTVSHLTTNGESVWALLADQQGVIEITNGQLKLIPFENESLLQNIYFMVADQDGNVWLTDQNNIFVINGSGLRSGFPAFNADWKYMDEAISIRNVKADKKGNLHVLYRVVSSQERGILKINSDFEFMEIEIPAEVGNSFIFAMSFDSQNNLWIGTSKGILKLSE